MDPSTPPSPAGPPASPDSPLSPISAVLPRLQARWAAVPGNVRGIVWMLIATGLFSVMMALIKLAGTNQRLHVTQILLFRQLVMVVLAAPVIIRGFPESLQSSRVDLQLARVAAAFFAMLMGFTAVIELPLANAMTISFAKTFFTTILAIVILGEVVGPRRWGALIVGFVGVVIVAWPDPGQSLNIYALMALASAGCVGFVLILIRKLSQVDQPVTILTYQAVGVGLLMVPPTIYFWKTPTLEEWLIIFAIGLVSALGQTCNILGLRAAEASALAPLDYTRLIYALIFGWFLFGEWPVNRVFVGAGIIVAAALYTVHRERVKAKRASVLSGEHESGAVAAEVARKGKA